MTSDDTIPEVTQEMEYEQSIFRDREIVRPKVLPDFDRVVGRDEEMNSLLNVVKPAAFGDPPGDAAILSKPGTGKTLVAKYVAGSVRTRAREEGVNLVAAYVNCDEYPTETQVVKALADAAANSLEKSVRIPESGIATSRYYGYLYDVLADADTFVPILDEIDKLGENANDVIKTLADAQSDQKLCHTGMIIISNKTTFFNKLNPRVQSRLQNNDTELVFKPYNADQLVDILEHRRDAFHEGVLDDGVIELCAAYAGKEHGDARKALDLLLSAGERAEQQGKDQVTEADVRAVHEKAMTSREREVILASLEHAQFALFALAYLTKEHDDDEFRTGQIYDAYRILAQAEGLSPQTHQNVLNHLKDWAEVELTENFYTSGGRGKGTHRFHKLMINPDVPITTIQQDVLSQNGLKTLSKRL